LVVVVVLVEKQMPRGGRGVQSIMVVGPVVVTVVVVVVVVNG
jgi:hypothetical protein